MKKIELMHCLFGKEGGQCKDCSHIRIGFYRERKIVKCEVYGVSGSNATDWALRNQCCGLKNKATHEHDIYKKAKRENNPPAFSDNENQLRLF